MASYQTTICEMKMLLSQKQRYLESLRLWCCLLVPWEKTNLYHNACGLSWRTWWKTRVSLNCNWRKSLTVWRQFVHLLTSFLLIRDLTLNLCNSSVPYVRFVTTEFLLASFALKPLLHVQWYNGHRSILSTLYQLLFFVVSIGRELLFMSWGFAAGNQDNNR